MRIYLYVLAAIVLVTVAGAAFAYYQAAKPDCCDPVSCFSRCRAHFQVLPSSSDNRTSRLLRPLTVSLETSTQCPLASRIASRPLPGLGNSVTPTGPHDTPSSWDSAMRIFFSGPF